MVQEKQLHHQFPCDTGSMEGLGCAEQAEVQSWNPGLGWEPRDVSCIGWRRKANLPHQSSHCIPHLWKMGKGALGSGFGFRAPVCNACQGSLRTWLTLGEGAEGAASVCSQLSPVYSLMKESPLPCCIPTVRSQCCLTLNHLPLPA